jgi:stage VI sporulation protein D
LTDSKLNQLRFDISEKVRLHPQQPGIETLLELDLYPDVEILDEGKHLKIKGYLRLNGAYLGEQAKSQVDNVQESKELETHLGREELAYVIPVEITLPANRAELENVSAEVEAFDYSVISPFELQVEAILMIGGLNSESKEEKELVTKTDEFPTFTAKPIVNEQTTDDDLQPNKDIDKLEPKLDGVETTPIIPENYQNEKYENQKENTLSFYKDNDNTKIDKTKSLTNMPLSNVESSDQEEKDLDLPQSSLNSYADESSFSLHDFWTNRQEKNNDSTLFHGSDKHIQEFSMEKESEVALDSTSVDSSAHNSEHPQQVDWIKWLMGSREETFVPMRMVIVQRMDSIDHLAEK